MRGWVTAPLLQEDSIGERLVWCPVLNVHNNISMLIELFRFSDLSLGEKSMIVTEDLEITRGVSWADIVLPSELGTRPKLEISARDTMKMPSDWSIYRDCVNG